MRLAKLVGILALVAACSEPKTGGAGANASPDAGTGIAAPPAADGGTQAVTGPAYHVVDLGTVRADAISVLDMSRNGLVLAAAESSAFVYDAVTGVARDVPAGMTAINSSGTTAGIRGTGIALPSGACQGTEVYLQAADGTLEGLGDPTSIEPGAQRCPSPGSDRKVIGVDDAGRVVAQWEALENNQIVVNLYLWGGEAWQKLPTLGGDFTIANSIRDGVVAGESNTPRAADFGTERHAVVWKGATLVDLGDGSAMAVDGSGKVVGTANHRHAQLLDGNRSVDLGTLPGFDSVARAVNAKDEIVGDANLFSNVTDWEARAVLFDGGRVLDLNDLVDAHDLLLTSALRIGDDGVIAANALGSRPRPAVLVPTGAPKVPDRAWRSHGAVLADGEPAVALALDEDNVYWIASGDQQVAVKTAPKSGGGAVLTLFTGTSLFTYGSLAVDDRYVWFDLTPCTALTCGPTAVWRVPKTGGAAERFADGGAALALTDTTAYVVTNDSFENGLRAVPKAGGTAVSVVSGQELGRGLAADAAGAYLVQTKLMFGNFNLPVLSFASGGQVVDLSVSEIQGGFSSGTLLLDESSIYLRDAHGLWRFARAGGAPALLASSVAAGMTDVAFDGTFFYVLHRAATSPFVPSCVARIPKSGGAPECLDASSFRYASVRSDATSIYFIRDTEIVRLPTR